MTHRLIEWVLESDGKVLFTMPQIWARRVYDCATEMRNIENVMNVQCLRQNV